MRTELTHLSKLIGFQVLDENGENLGLASDYIVNTCETFVIYLLMEPAAELTIEPGGLVAIPYEAVTVNSGVLDAQNQAIQLRLQPGQLSGAPVISAGQPLTPTDWEEEVRAFWSQVVRIGSLKTSCNVPGGPVYKVAYASQLLGAALYDGRGEMLGTVQEAILAPESGKLAFYIVKPSSGEGLVMVRLAVTNIPKEALAPGGTLSLELLTEPQMFWQAPRITSLDEADGFTVQGKMLQYWGR
jgi:sporulation protein YlmC with PRC-barrel domain